MNKDKRFIVIDGEQTAKYKDPKDLAWAEAEGFGGEGSYLVDTKTNEIVYSDQMEPEDRYLFRALHPLVDLLNKVASE